MTDVEIDAVIKARRKSFNVAWMQFTLMGRPFVADCWPSRLRRIKVAPLPFEGSMKMAVSDELTKLEQLRERGALTEDEYARAKASVLDAAPGEPRTAMLNGLRRSRSDRWLGGVCGGLAKLLGFEAWIVRLVFTLLLAFGGTGLIVYVLMWIFVPNEEY